MAEGSVIRDKAVEEMRGHEKKVKDGKGDKENEEHGLHYIKRWMLCWPTAADSSSKVQDRNHSCLFVCDREGGGKKRADSLCKTARDTRHDELRARGGVKRGK